MKGPKRRIAWHLAGRRQLFSLTMLCPIALPSEQDTGASPLSGFNTKPACPKAFRTVRR